MTIDRRSFLGGMAVLAGTRIAGPPPAPVRSASRVARSQQSLQDRIVARATQTRLRLEFDGTQFAGAGWAKLVDEGKAAQFFLLGEEHGTSQIPALTRQLMLALRPVGYERLAIEVSAPVAAELDIAARGGVEGIRRFIAEYPPGPAFYNYRQEAEMLAAVRSAYAGKTQLLWGLDYEVIQDRRLIARLTTKAPPSAKAAVRVLDEASAGLWKQFEATRNPQFIFSFAGDAQLVRAVRDAWPTRDPSTDVILDVLEGTLETNALWVKGRGWESNERRTRLMRGQFARYWHAERAAGRAPKTFFKFGASHMGRGRDMSEVYDIGSLASEAAALEGRSSFHLFAAPMRTARHGQFNPSTMGLTPMPASYFDEQGVGFLADVGFPDAATLIDLRSLRPLLGDHTKDFDSRAVRVILGFDAMLVLGNATPAVML